MGVLLYPLALRAALVLAAFGFGASLPVAHLGSRSTPLPARPEVVWGLMRESPISGIAPREREHADMIGQL